MLILNADEVRQALPMTTAIQAVKKGYAALSAGNAVMPLRTQLPVAPHEGVTLLMPAYISGEGESLAIKIVSVFTNNHTKNLPIIYGTVLVLDPETGQSQAVMDGTALTAIRTGAASGAATDLLARPNSKTVAIFGAGAQGRTQLEAVCSVRAIETVWVYDPNSQYVRDFIAEMAGHGPVPQDLRAATSPEQAIADADIICTATTSRQPVFPAEAVRPGTHINGVGSYTLEMIEVPPEIMPRAAVFVDSREAVMEEAGELVAAINRKLLFPAELTELGEVVLGTAPGRQSPQQITFFKSVGVAVQDTISAQAALQNAREQGLGQNATW